MKDWINFDKIDLGPNYHLYIEIGLTFILIILFFIAKKIVGKLIRKHAFKEQHEKARMTYIIKLVNFGMSIIFLTLIAIVWEVSIQGLSVYFASFFAVVGVAFFAVWSILSNITAYAILFFYFPYKIGTRVKIVDGDNSVEGKIDDLTIFYIKIKATNGELITYPNNLALQKPIQQIGK